MRISTVETAKTTRVVRQISLQSGAIPLIVKAEKSKIYILWGFSL